MGRKMMIVLKISMLSAIMLLLVSINSVGAGEVVSCRYLQSEGKNILLELSITAPVPHMVIVVQRIPPAASIVNASPGYKKYDAQRGVAKWMLTGLKPGPMQMVMTLDKPVHKGEVTGEIRYKHPATGHMVNMAISP